MARGLLSVPLAPVLIRDWNGSKGLRALIEPKGPPSCLGVFTEGEIKGWVIFPRVPDRALQLPGGVTQNPGVTQLSDFALQESICRQPLEDPVERKILIL